MNDMTPAPISVERLSALREAAITDNSTTVVRSSTLLALLHQLADLQAKTACTLGVGDGSGKLFVHGDYESIKAAQAVIAKLAERDAEVERLDGLVCAHLSRISELEAAYLHYRPLAERAEAAERAREWANRMWREAFIGVVQAALIHAGMEIEKANISANEKADHIAAYLAAASNFTTAFRKWMH